MTGGEGGGGKEREERRRGERDAESWMRVLCKGLLDGRPARPETSRHSTFSVNSGNYYQEFLETDGLCLS